MSKIVYKKYSIDSKNFSTLFLVLFWLVLGFIVCFFGITKTYASEQKTGLGFLNNSSVYISNNKGADIQLTRQTANNVNMDIKSIVFISNYNFQANTVYDYEIQITGQYLRNVDKATILSNNGICTLIGLSGLGEEYTKVRFTCSSATSSITIGLSNSNDNNVTNGYNINWQSIYLWSITDTIDLGPIINNQSQNTQDILNNDNQNTNNIIDNNNQNTQDIIDSNKETQDVIKDQFNSCKDSLNIFDISSYPITNQTGYNSTGTLKYWDGYYGIRDFFPVNANTTYTYSQKNPYINFSVVYYDSDKNIISNLSFWSTSKFTTPENTAYIRFSVESSSIPTEVQIELGSIATKYGPYGGQVCYNKLDEQNETQKGIWATIKDLPNMFLDMLLGLFIPDDLSFIDNFKDVISNKLGFIASIPIQIIDFMLGLANVAFEEITTISFPSISIFGFNFWNAEEIDITILLDKLKPFKYFTDFTCVILCCRTLYDFYHSFTGGDVN